MEEAFEIETLPLAVMEAQEARDHRVVVALGVAWSASVVALMGVATWLILPI